MVWRALCALGRPCRLDKGQDIATGALFRKPCPQGTPGKERGAAPLLLVPGGNARLKARALGEKGRQAVRDYLAGTRTDCEGKVESAGLPKSDVLYFELEGGAWVCIRPSGTEPKIKLYVNTNAKEAEVSAKENAELIEACKALMA